VSGEVGDGAEKRIIGIMTGRNQHNEDLSQNGSSPLRQSMIDEFRLTLRGYAKTS